MLRKICIFICIYIFPQTIPDSSIASTVYKKTAGIKRRTDNGKIIGVHEYMKGISKKGYLFQKVLEPHVDMVRLTKDAIASCRFLIFNLDDKAIIHSCCLKITD